MPTLSKSGVELGPCVVRFFRAGVHDDLGGVLGMKNPDVYQIYFECFDLVEPDIDYSIGFEDGRSVPLGILSVVPDGEGQLLFALQRPQPVRS